ncbi:MAG: hypothetical protein WCX83_04960 [Candidatus Cloacimonas sp.]|nr:hypothetical protein [Candidatus Cloacimonadota bacterium]
MNEFLKLVVKIITWVLIIGAFASLGFGTDNPKLMVPLYALFFIVVFGLVLFYSMKQQKTKKVVDKKHSSLLMGILGIVLVTLGVITPYVVFRGVGFSVGIYFMISFVTILLLGVSIFAISLINKHTFVNSLLGYILLILVSATPAFIMSQHDKTYHALGLAYYTALSITIFFWFGVSLIGSNFRK